MAQIIYSFNEGNKNMRAQLGGKGANLSEMTKIGLPVPFGFILASSLCNDCDWGNGEFSEELVAQLPEKLAELETVSGKKFGGSEKSAVRFGALVGQYFDAGNDEYGFECGTERRNSIGFCNRIQKRTFRIYDI